MALTRRGLLALLGGGAAGAASGATPKDVLGALRGEKSLRDEYPVNYGAIGSVSDLTETERTNIYFRDAANALVDRAMSGAREKAYRRSELAIRGELRAVQTPKSWGAAFREHVAEQEDARLREDLRAVEAFDRQPLAKKLDFLERLGVPVPDEMVAAVKWTDAFRRKNNPTPAATSPYDEDDLVF